MAESKVIHKGGGPKETITVGGVFSKTVEGPLCDGVAGLKRGNSYLIADEWQDVTCMKCLSKRKYMSEDEVNNMISVLKEDTKSGFKIGLISDGYHTFNELYDFRKMYNAALFNEWASDWRKWDWNIMEVKGHGFLNGSTKYNVHKSKRHFDGEECFGGGWFIVCAKLPTGQISNHYRLEDWDLFDIPETEKALFEFDGHTGEDVLERLKSICGPGSVPKAPKR